MLTKRTQRKEFFPTPLRAVSRASHRAKCERRSGLCELDLLSISRLATLLANGVDVRIGQTFPDGWDNEAGERTRRYAICSAEYKTAAHRLLSAQR